MQQFLGVTRYALAAGAVAAVLAVTGCSAGAPAHKPFVPISNEPSAGAPLGNQIGGLDPAAILQRAQAATAAASFVHVRGEVAGGTSGKPFQVDMRFTATGSEGQIVDDGKTAGVTRVQNQVWLRGDERFWREVGQTTSQVANTGKYVQVPVNDKRFTGLVESTYLERLVTKLIGRPGALEKGETREINGRRAIELLVEPAKGVTGRIWVATEGPPFLLKLETTPNSRLRGSVDFLGYNERIVVAAPEPDMVVDRDLSQPSNRATRAPAAPAAPGSSSGSSSGSTGGSSSAPVTSSSGRATTSPGVQGSAGRGPAGTGATTRPTSSAG